MLFTYTDIFGEIETLNVDDNHTEYSELGQLVDDLPYSLTFISRLWQNLSRNLHHFLIDIGVVVPGPPRLLWHARTSSYSYVTNKLEQNPNMNCCLVKSRNNGVIVKGIFITRNPNIFQKFIFGNQYLLVRTQWKYKN